MAYIPEINEQAIDAFVEENWEAYLEDLDSLIKIPSTESKNRAVENAPWGPGPRAALTQMLEIAAHMGFETCDLQGYIGYAQFSADARDNQKAHTPQIGIIGHLDVVPDGPGWNFMPYQLTRKDGYLIGRGVLDDKGPSLAALYAMKYWKDAGAQFPYDIRFLFGANEETGMGDVPYYRARFDDPDFLFTPDASFPVAYGEKGVYQAVVTSGALDEGNLLELSGGMAANAVPGTAHAKVRVTNQQLEKYFADGLDEVFVAVESMVSAQEALGLTLVKGDGCLIIDAQGKSAHASTPWLGVSAIYMLASFLLSEGLAKGSEEQFLKFVCALTGNTNGCGIGIECSDDYFGELTTVGGVIALKEIDGACYISQTVDSRFPTTITSGVITDTLKHYVSEWGAISGATITENHVMEPFLMDSNSPMIQALLNSYNEVTGEDRQPFTMGGATYAREFTSAASFGVEKAWEEIPSWVGGMHGPDEGIKEDNLKEAMKIYIITLQKLMKIAF